MAKKILLAEDSVTMQQIVQMTFAAEDFTVTSASSADEALARAKEMDPDVVIADLSLTGKSGYDLCAAIKSQSDRTPVLLLHGSGAKFDAARARQVRADGDIGKPFDSQALIDKVKDVLSTTHVVVQGPIESLSAPIESGPEDIVIDTEAPPAAAFPAARAVEPQSIPLAMPPRSASPPAQRPAPAVRPLTPPPVARPAPAARAPVAPPPRPMAAPPMPPSLVATPHPAAMQRPPPVAAIGLHGAATGPITIEAQPPPRRPEPLQPFNRPTPAAPLPAIESRRPDRPMGTLMGLGEGTEVPAPPPDLPPPPPGMALPGIHAKAPAAAPPQAQPPAVVRPPAQAGAGLDPAVAEAISRLTKEVVERIVWEVVPDLAERIIREQIDRLVDKHRQ